MAEDQIVKEIEAFINGSIASGMWASQMTQKED